MLAGLIFATEDAADRPDALAATLPFGGASLIEFQARLLMTAGAAHLLIAVARVTPELLGAAARIQQRGVTVDIVRSAAEAVARVHPLAHVVVLADGLVTTEAILAPLTGEGGDILLVTDDAGVPIAGGEQRLERIDPTSCWAGIARLGAQRLSEAARLPRDYDFLSTLLRVAAQHGAAKLLLGPGSLREGHGVERDGRGLARRGRGVFAALAGTRERWAERWVLAPLARLALPALVARAVAPPAVIGAGVVLGLGALAVIWAGWCATGLGVATLAAAVLLTGGMLAWLRGEETVAQWVDRGGMVLAAAAILLTGFADSEAQTSATVGVLAVVVVVAGGLVERMRALAAPRRWWPAPAAYPLLLLPFVAVGHGTIGLAGLALYAAGAVLGGIEDVRAKP